MTLAEAQTMNSTDLEQVTERMEEGAGREHYSWAASRSSRKPQRAPKSRELAESAAVE